MQQLLQLQGVTYEDIQRIFEKVVAEAYPHKPALIYLDVAYLYTFKPSDIPYIQKFTDRMRLAQEHNPERNPLQIEWHRFLEKWYDGRYVDFNGRTIKPIQIERTIDRVVNEFMERIASAMAGFGDFAPMKFNALGDGAVAGTAPSPGDTALANELDRIDVTSQVGGGGLTVDGSTFMNIGNHDRFMTSGDITEVGIFDAELPGAGEDDVPIIDDRMGDHSIFPNEVPHTSGQDAAGASTIIYQCSS
jgi:hypothetical protein